MTLWIRKRSLIRFPKVTCRTVGVWAPRAAAASYSVIVHSEILIMIQFVKGGTELSDKDASLLCGIYTDCSLRQVCRVLSSVTGWNLLFVENIVLLWLSYSSHFQFAMVCRVWWLTFLSLQAMAVKKRDGRVQLRGADASFWKVKLKSRNKLSFCVQRTFWEICLFIVLPS